MDISSLIIAITGLITGVLSLVVSARKDRAAAALAADDAETQQHIAIQQATKALAENYGTMLEKMTRRIEVLETERETFMADAEQAERAYREKCMSNIEDMQKEIVAVRERLVMLSGINRHLWHGVNKLMKQIADEGLTPVWSPSPDWMDAMKALEENSAIPPHIEGKRVGAGRWVTL